MQYSVRITITDMVTRNTLSCMVWNIMHLQCCNAIGSGPDSTSITSDFV